MTRDELETDLETLLIGTPKMSDVMGIIDEHAAAERAAERERLAVEYERVRDEYYPTDVFGGRISTDDSRAANDLLRENDLPPIDQFSANVMRHAYTQAAKMARDINRSGGDPDE